MPHQVSPEQDCFLPNAWREIYEHEFLSLEQVDDALEPLAVHSLAPAAATPGKCFHQFFEAEGWDLGLCPSQQGQFPFC